jgi:hypothetical protein
MENENINLLKRWAIFTLQLGLGIFLFTTASGLALAVHSASYPMGTGGSFPEGKTAGA